MKRPTIPAAHGNPLERTGTMLLLATMTGVAVATLYYTQPMLALMGADLGQGDAAMSLVPMLTQLGYALGLLFLGPLGDRHDRRGIVLIKSAVLFVTLILSALAPNLMVLALASLGIGLAATLAQDIVSGVAMLAPDHARGRLVGTAMTGLLLGILGSRVISGFVGETLGWRAMLGLAALSIASLWLTALRGMPTIPARSTLGYGQLLASVGHLWQRHAVVRRAAWAQALVAVAFSAFWSTLALMLHDEPFHLGSTAAGLFGLAGAAGALIAPLAGRLIDRRGPVIISRWSTAIAAISFAIPALAPLLGAHGAIWLLVLGVVGFDLGMQATTVSHQSIIYGIDPAARSRLNAILLFGMFIGMATGAGLGGLVLGQFGWLGVVALSALASGAAFVVRLTAPAALADQSLPVAPSAQPVVN